MGENNLTRGLTSQLLAGLAMLADCIDRCPADEWDKSHGDHPFSQVLFHALFDCDYHLCDPGEDVKAQGFHREHREIFADYAELAELPATRLYSRDFIRGYCKHCRAKATAVIEAKRAEELLVPNSDVRGNMTKLERYVNLIRHLQHHAAQLGLRLQFVTGAEMEWVSRGYGS